MEPLNLTAVQEYVNENIVDFHEKRRNSLERLKLSQILRKNAYLYRAKNLVTAAGYVEASLNAFLSSSEEELFGRFLEGLAVFVAQQTSRGHKSTAEGVDLEFFNKGIHYVVSVKSGTRWGNSSQHNTLEQNLKDAVRRVKQYNQALNVQSVLGICYGKTRTVHTRRGYLKVVGQNFWYLVSESKSLYTDIIKPLEYKAHEHNERFLVEKVRITNILTKAFIDTYCDQLGAIDWKKIVRFTCGNYDMDKFLP